MNTILDDKIMTNRFDWRVKENKNIKIIPLTRTLPK
jgi:hypothetical protein